MRKNVQWKNKAGVPRTGTSLGAKGQKLACSQYSVTVRRDSKRKSYRSFWLGEFPARGVRNK